MYQREKTKRRKHRKYEIGREAAETEIKEEKKKKIRVRGGGEKIRLFGSKVANVFFKEKRKSEKCEILSVEKNPANKDFTRRGIITKGAILTVKTPQDKEIKVRVTSRPGQDGVINGIEI